MLLKKLSPNGLIEKEHIRYVGKPYSFWQRIRSGGVGSQKVIYISGIKEFDRYSQTNRETNHVNFERFTEGIAIRFFKRHTGYYRGWVCLLRYSDFQTKIISKTRSVYHIILITPESEIVFEINVGAVESFKSFIKKEIR